MNNEQHPFELTQNVLKHLLHYDPAGGVFTWLNPLNDRVRKGSEAGWIGTTQSGKSYRQIGINNKVLYCHRLAFLYMTGELPSADVDHINGDGTDNRWCNLRVVSRRDNLRNQKLRANNTSGVTGVSLIKNGWRASIYIEGRNIYLGTFKEFDNAVAARKQAEQDYKFHKNHGQVRPL